MGQFFNERPFVMDAETLQYMLEQEETAECRTKLLQAISDGHVLVTKLTMRQLKENCPKVYGDLRAVGVEGVGTDALNEPTGSMINNARVNGLDVSSSALRAKMYALALASSKGCCVVSVDCRETQISILTLAKHFSIRVKCIGAMY